MFVRRMIQRELRFSWRRLVFFFICIAIGVGAIVTLRSVIHSVRQAFAGEARSLIAADAVISSNREFPDALRGRIDERLAAAGAQSTRSVELATMVRGEAEGSRTRMVELKAVEAGFPYYGRVTLAGGQPYDFRLLENGGAIVRPELEAQLGLGVGDRIVIGGRSFEIRALLDAEPGRRLGAFSLGPRVFVSMADLQQTGLVSVGSRATHQQLVRVPDAALDPLVTELRADFTDSFVRIRSYKAQEDDIGEDFERAENYLSLVGLVIVVLGGIGVSSVTRVFVQQKIRAIAVLKCVGARSSQLLAIYLAQVVVLGLLGSVMGVALAWLTVHTVPGLLLGPATPGVTITYGLTPSAVSQGVAIGLAVSLLFAIVPLLDVRHVKPSRLLRDDSVRAPRDWWQLAAVAGVALALVGLTIWQAGSWRIGLVVIVGLLATAGALHVAGLVMVRAIAPLARSRRFALRHAVLQLARPGSQARIVLLAVGLGSFFIVGVRALQENLLQQFALDVSNEAPDMFLIDIQSDQVDAVRGAIRAVQEPGSPEPRLIPVLRARVTGVEGRTLQLERYEDVRERGSLAREYTVTFREGLEQNEQVIQGAFWSAPGPSAADATEVSIEESVALRFGIAPGDLMRFDVLGRPMAARVTSVRRVNWGDSRAGGFMFVFRPGMIDRAPHGAIGFFKGPTDAAARAGLQATLVQLAPNVSVIDGREILQAVKGVVDNVTLAVTVVGSLVVVSGLLILIGAVSMTKFRRVYEAAIFKTLGAGRPLMTAVLTIEYGLLGLLAGTIGAGAALGLTWGISRFALDIPFRALPGLTAGAIVATTVLVALVGVASSWDVLTQKPLGTLRGE